MAACGVVCTELYFTTKQERWINTPQWSIDQLLTVSCSTACSLTVWMTVVCSLRQGWIAGLQHTRWLTRTSYNHRRPWLPFPISKVGHRGELQQCREHHAETSHQVNVDALQIRNLKRQEESGLNNRDVKNMPVEKFNKRRFITQEEAPISQVL